MRGRGPVRRGSDVASDAAPWPESEPPTLPATVIPVRHTPPHTARHTACGTGMWWTIPNSSTNSTNSAHTARRPYGTTSIGFAPPNGLRASPHRSWCPLKFAPHCLSTKRQADIVASLGTHMNSGTLLKSCPCGQRRDCVAEQSTVRQFRCRGSPRANNSRRRNCLRSIFLFSRFAKFRVFPISLSAFGLFALYNATGARQLWPGMTPVSGRRPPAGVASVVLPDEAAKLEGRT